MNYTIDATNKTLGRLASDIAMKLMGKNGAAYAPNVLSGNKVVVSNASKLSIRPARLANKTYKRYSGYPGGLTEESMTHLVAKKGYKEVIAIAVKGMLPDNKLKNEMMKCLTVTE